MKYKMAVCGGTFDLLHAGHKSFLSQILEESEKVLVGLTSDNYVSQNKEQIFEDFGTRKKNLEIFLSSGGNSDRWEIIPIDDVYGPLLNKDLSAQALFVSTQTQKGAEEINKKREELGLPAIAIEVVEMKKAQDGELISSTRIRNGEINRDGKLCINPDWVGKRLILPQSLRGELAKPFGQILESVPDVLDPEEVVTIGDETTKNFNEKKVNQRLSVVDFVVKRERKFDRLEDLGFGDRIETQIIENSPGEITWELFEAIKKSLIFNRAVILVNGEEDLAVLPTILVSPLGFRVYYGQPNVGMIEIQVNEEKKEKAYKLLSHFELS